MATEAILQVKLLAPQDMANLCWSYAVLVAFNLQLLQTVSEEAVQKMQTFIPQDLSNLVWALAKLDLRERTLLAAVASSAALKMKAFLPQHLSNLAWAFATLDAYDDALFHAISREAMMKLEDFTPQGLSNVAWGLSTVRASDMGLFNAMLKVAAQRGNLEPQCISNMFWAFAKCSMSSTSGKGAGAMNQLLRSTIEQSGPGLQAFKGQELSNLVWAAATMGIQEGPVFRAVASEVAAKFEDVSLPELANLAWGFAVAGDKTDPGFLQVVADETAARLHNFTPSSVPSAYLSEAATAINSIVWALDFAGLMDDDLLSLARQSLLQLGCTLDSLKACPRVSVLHQSQPAFRTSSAEPQIVLQLPDRLVIQKPCLWEGDDAVEESHGLSLTSYMQAEAPGRLWPIFRDRGHQMGFLHRLDLPSSGLLLAAKTYSAFYALQLELNGGGLARDYAVLCHGWPPPARRDVEAPLRWRGGPGDRSPSRVDGSGRPARSRLRVLAHALARSSGVGLAAVRIASGRRHQIRVHAAHVGCPVVRDPRYAPGAGREDRAWCSRNFLHRYRLSFPAADASSREALAPMPSDLTKALARLRPRDEASARALSRWSGGLELRDWAQLVALKAVRVRGSESA